MEEVFNEFFDSKEKDNKTSWLYFLDILPAKILQTAEVTLAARDWLHLPGQWVRDLTARLPSDFPPLYKRSASLPFFSNALVVPTLASNVCSTRFECLMFRIARGKISPVVAISSKSRECTRQQKRCHSFLIPAHAHFVGASTSGIHNTHDVAPLSDNKQ